MIGFWIFLIILCICLTFITCVYLSDVADIDWHRYKEIMQELEKIQKAINETKEN